jgi:hypothetical protein
VDVEAALAFGQACKRHFERHSFPFREEDGSNLLAHSTIGDAIEGRRTCSVAGRNFLVLAKR